MAERRGRIAAEQVAHALMLVNALPFEEDEHTAEEVPGRILSLARRHQLTVYDAAYLELALRRGAALASFDEQLVRAARQEKASVA
jgi:predicted nucleic acid-binding protein